MPKPRRHPLAWSAAFERAARLIDHMNNHIESGVRHFGPGEYVGYLDYEHDLNEHFLDVSRLAGEDRINLANAQSPEMRARRERRKRA